MLARSIPVLVLWCSIVLGTTVVLHALWRRSWRSSLLGGSVVTGTLVWWITEWLGVLHRISLAGVSLAWIVVLVPLGFSVRWACRQPADGRLPDLRSAPLEHRVLWTLTILACLLLGLIALWAAPNTWDSLTYHLSRVMHWEQNQSLWFYPTAIERQLSFGPLAEMGLLNLQVLVGGDQLANLIQFSAMLGCLAATSLIAERLGANPGAQLFAAFATLTLPMGILQSTSTQTDYVAALWCAGFVVLADTQWRSGSSFSQAVLAGAALGLCLTTKATSVIFLAPFIVWQGARLVGAPKLRAWRPAAIMLATAAIIVAPHSWRTYSMYGNPLGMTTGQEQGYYVNGIIGLPSLLSNVLRNVGSQLGTPIAASNRAIEAGISGLHRFIGIDVNDPQTTWPGSQYQLISARHEDSEGNPLHLILLVVAAVLLIRGGTRMQRIYLICLVAAFLLFSLVLRWQPWGNRLLLPLFVLAMPFAATVLGARLRGTRILLPATVLSLAAIPYLLANPSRPILGSDSIFLKDRLHQYFTNVPDDITAYEAAARAIREAACSEVGLVTRYDGREYLAWITVRQQVPDARLEHILVKNRSARYENDDLDPCAVIILKGIPADTLAFRGRDFLKVVESDTLDLFVEN